MSRVTLFHSKLSRLFSSASVLGAFFRCLVIDTPDAEKNEQEKFGGNKHVKIASPSPVPVSAGPNTSESSNTVY